MSKYKKRQAPDLAALRRIASELRQDILRMIAKAGSGHPGGSLSEVELLTGLYWVALRHDPARPDWPDRDLFLLSKGHGCPALQLATAIGLVPRMTMRDLRDLARDKNVPDGVRRVAQRLYLAKR